MKNTQDGAGQTVPLNSLVNWLEDYSAQLSKNTTNIADNGEYLGAYVDEMISLFIYETLIDEIKQKFS